MAGKRGPQKGAKYEPNEFRKTVAEMCESRGYDPILAMIDIAQDPSYPIELRVKCHMQVAKYRHPQLRTVTLETDEDTKLVIEHRYARPKATSDEDES